MPFSATLTFDLAGAQSSLSAVFPNAVLEGVEPFSLVVRSSSGGQLPDGTYWFRGDYLGEIEPSGSQYLFDWRFSTASDGGVLWNGNIGWSGGRNWVVTISDVALVPEPGTVTVDAPIDVRGERVGAVRIVKPTVVMRKLLEDFAPTVLVISLVLGAAAALAAAWIGREPLEALAPGRGAVLLGALPIGIYVASYAPYFALGHSFSDFLTLQRGMYDYHSQLTATHPFGSPGSGWPFGHRAVWVYLSDAGARRTEIWAAGNPVVFIGGLAETNRAPFDLPEAEQELTGGFHTEYSGMRFALFFLAEYANMIVVSSVATTLFFGGWLRPFPNWEALSFLDVIPSWFWFLIKSFIFLYIFIWVRATLPRYRYDQLMQFGWKWLFPASVINLIVTAALVLYLNA